MRLRKIDECRCELPCEDEMRVAAMIYTSSRLPLEEGAVGQLCAAAALPPVVKILATPDIHLGFGVPIGCVMGLQDAIMPAAVGYDINCGMRLLRTALFQKDCDVERLARSLARDIPLGEGKSNVALDDACLDAVLSEGLGALPSLIEALDHRAWQGYEAEEFRDDVQAAERGGCLPGKIEFIPDAARQKGGDQLGTLGGGNHFIEIQAVDKVYDMAAAAHFGLASGQLTVMIHSGSRRLGYEIADHYMRLAAEGMKDSGLNRQLTYLTADQTGFDAYLGAMQAAGNFAYMNRQIMTLLVRRCFRCELGPMSVPLIYDVSHNMAQLEPHDGENLWVHRKGATRAFGPSRMVGTAFQKIGQPVIIPGSMGTGSYLLLGRDSSEEALCSVNHGAGRTMSRTAALGKRSKRGQVLCPARISDQDFQQAMKGIYLIAGNKHSVKEEAPQAYKDIDEVIRVVAAAGLAQPVLRLRPLAVLKG